MKLLSITVFFVSLAFGLYELVQADSNFYSGVIIVPDSIRKHLAAKSEKSVKKQKTRVISYPPDAGIRDMKYLGAKGDGLTDDTAVIQDIFQNTPNTHMRTFYFPRGTYLVSKEVWTKPWVFIQGENRDETIIRLKDYSPSYQDPKHPKAVFGTTDPKPSKGCRNTNFSCHVMDLTIDTGKGNPGAIGIEFMSHNGGGLHRVTIRSGDPQLSGAFGIDMRRHGPGPALCKNVLVTGFDIGIEVANVVYTSTFEHIILRNQHVAAIRNHGHAIAIRGLISRNNVPAIINAGRNSQVVLLDSCLEDGSAQNAAIVNNGGSLFLRNLTVEGYKAAVREGKELISAEIVSGEYVNGPVRTLWGGKHSLNLPIKETPEMPWEDPGNWESVQKHKPPIRRCWFRGHNINVYDATEALQKAIDSGKTTVYFPHATYMIRDTINVRGNVKVLQGCGSILMADEKSLGKKPMLMFDDPDRGEVFLDRLTFSTFVWNHPITDVFHNSPKSLIVLHSRGMRGYTTGPNCGDLFVDDMLGKPWHFDHPQNVWMRQLNAESKDTKVFNNAARIWILGYKSEGRGTNIVTGPRAETEVLGGQVYPATPTPDTIPEWENQGRMSLVHTNFWANSLYIKDQKGGLTRELRIPKSERHIHLYVSDPSQSK